MWKVRCKVSVSVCACYVHTKCMYIQCACMYARGSDMFACVRLQSIFVCRSRGVNVRERVLGRLKVRHDAVQSEWVPPAPAPAAAWILFWYTHRGRLTGLPCSFCLYLSNRGGRKAILRGADNNGSTVSVELSCCGTQSASHFFTFDKMTVSSFCHDSYPFFSV